MDVIAARAAGTIMSPPRENFDSIGNAMTTVFILIIGEDWPAIMYNHSRVYGTTSGFYITFYFVSVLVVGNLMLLSLFTAILL